MTDDAETVREAVEYCRRDAVYHPAIAALSRLTARLDAERWQPIETAEKSSRAILVWCPERRNIYTVSWSDIEDEWLIFGGYARLDEFPIAWRSVPTPPETDNG